MLLKDFSKADEATFRSLLQRGSEIRRDLRVEKDRTKRALLKNEYAALNQQVLDIKKRVKERNSHKPVPWVSPRNAFTAVLLAMSLYLSVQMFSHERSGLTEASTDSLIASNVNLEPMILQAVKEHTPPEPEVEGARESEKQFIPSSEIPVQSEIVVATAKKVLKGDWIRLDNTIYENVLIRETPSMYYVQMPHDGSSLAVPKSSVDDRDVFISKDKNAREIARMEWKRQYDLNHPDTEIEVITPSPPPENSLPSPETFEKEASKLLERAELKKWAKFEAQYVYWKSLPKQNRQYILDSYIGRKQRHIGESSYHSEVYSSAQVQLESQTSWHLEQRASNHDAIALNNILQSAQTADALDDFDLHWNTSMRDGLALTRDIDRSYGDFNPYMDRAVQKYAIKVENDLDRVVGKVSSINNYYNGQKNFYANKADAHGRAAAALLPDIQKQVTNQRKAYALAANSKMASASFAARISYLEEAIRADYKPVLETLEVGSWQEECDLTTEVFEVTTPVWEIDVRVAGNPPVHVFKVVLCDGETGAPITLVSTADDLGMRSCIRDGKGQYLLKVKVNNSIPYRVRILEIR
jgi:hypothetical protein